MLTIRFIMLAFVIHPFSPVGTIDFAHGQETLSSADVAAEATVSPPVKEATPAEDIMEAKRAMLAEKLDARGDEEYVMVVGTAFKEAHGGGKSIARFRKTMALNAQVIAKGELAESISSTMSAETIAVSYTHLTLPTILLV